MREPRIFLDQNHAEMMVYALENHLQRIYNALDRLGVPKTDFKDSSIKLTCEQRVKLMISKFREYYDPEVNGKMIWTHLKIAPDVMTGPDPEELSVMLFEKHKLEDAKQCPTT